jgi:nucleoside-diphosphate-sugar epimerase
MRIAVTGATGNVGTSVVAALAADPAVDEIVGLSRRAPQTPLPGMRHVRADIVTDDLEPHFAGAEAVIHLAWLIQPSRDRRVTEAVNVTGSRRVFDAAAAAGVPTVVHASSIGAYSPGPKDRSVDESWPTGGTPSSFYAVDKSSVERILDRFETAHPEIRVVRLRPGLIFKREAASEIRRLFAGPFLPNVLLRPGLIAVVPRIERLRFQAVHADDVAQAYRLAALEPDARGAYNIAAAPVLDPDELGRILGAKPVPVDRRIVRALADLTWRARLQPTPPGWFDMALAVPLMDTARARRELGWTPRRTAAEALLELLDGMRHGAGAPTPPLAPGGSGLLRLGELAAGVGRRN